MQPSHSLRTLTGLFEYEPSPEELYYQNVEGNAETEVDAELDALFEDIFDEDSLDLDSLLDF